MDHEQPRLSTGKWRFHAWALTLLVVLGTAVYSNSLDSPFVADDTPNIVENHRTRVRHFNLDNFYHAGFHNISPRPIAHLSFALNYYFGEYEVRGYHLVNLAIHLLCGVVVYWLAIRTYALLLRREPTLAGAPSDPTQNGLALLAAVLFVVHPVQTQAVTYLVQRMTSLAALFYLLSLWFYVEGRLYGAGRARWGFWIGSLFAGMLALGTKPNTATLPAAILLYEWYFFQDLSAEWIKRRLKIIAGIGAVIGLVSLVYLGESPWQQILDGYERRDFTMGQRVLTQLRVVVFYLSLVVLPLPGRMNLLHGISTSQGLFDPITTFLALLVLVGLIVVAVVWARRDRLLSFAIVWFLMHLVIESSVIALEMIFEHRLYLPLFGVALYVPLMLYQLLAKRGVALQAVAVLTVLSLSLCTYLRNADWRDEITLWTDVVSKNPTEARGFLARADAYAKNDNPDLALNDYAKAIELDAQYPNSFLNRGKFYLKQGNLQLAVRDMTQALELDSEFQRAYINRADVYTRLRKFDQAVADYSEAIELAPDLAAAFNNRGLVYGRMGNKQAALEDFAQAVALEPDFGQAYFNRASYYRNLREYQLAIEDYQRSIKLDPRVAEAYLGRGICYESLGLWAEAVADFQEAISLGADKIPANKRLAWLYAACGDAKVRDGQKAVDYATKACGMADWKSPNCLESLAAAYAELGNFASAIQWQSKAIELAKNREQGEMLRRQELYRQSQPYRLEIKAASN